MRWGSRLLQDRATGTDLQVSITAYKGTLRLQVDEPGADRFQVADPVTQLQTAALL
jgi:hypothetical protein